MTPLSTINLLRVLFVCFSALVGAQMGVVLELGWPAGVAIGTVVGLLLVLIDRLLRGFTLRAFSSATFGLLIGLLFASLLRASRVLYYLPGELEWGLSLLFYASFGYLGMMLAMRSNRDEFSLLIPYVRFTRQAVEDEPVVVDTSVLIDGRVPDVAAAGFLSGALVVPRFVVRELQALADSHDAIKRERGRRGLDHLNEMQQKPGLGVDVQEETVLQSDEEESVDYRLALLAKKMNARLLTNDTGLAKIARLQGLRVLNLNDLARAMRPVVNPGDTLDLYLVKEGKESHQSVGYLPDGTMIVVNHSHDRIGETVSIVVGGTLMTSAGRLVFAELSDESNPVTSDWAQSNDSRGQQGADVKHRHRSGQ